MPASIQRSVWEYFKLTPHSESLLREYLAHGSYRTPEEVIERALETLAEKEAGTVPTTATPETRTLKLLTKVNFES
jgi:hypothetical protein